MEQGEKPPVAITAALAIALGVDVRLDSRASLTADLESDGIRRLFRCSSQDPQLKASGVGDGSGWGSPQEWSSYVFNEALLGRRDKPYDFPQGHVARVRHSSTVML